MATVVLVHRRVEELGRRRGFFEVDDELAEVLVARGDAKVARRNRRGAAIVPRGAPALVLEEPESELEGERAGELGHEPVTTQRELEHPAPEPDLELELAAPAKPAATRSGKRPAKRKRG